MTPSVRMRAGAGAGHHGRHGEDARADDAADDQRGGRRQPEAARPTRSAGWRRCRLGRCRSVGCHGCGHGSPPQWVPRRGRPDARSVRPRGQVRLVGPTRSRRLRDHRPYGCDRASAHDRAHDHLPRRLRGRGRCDACCCTAPTSSSGASRPSNCRDLLFDDVLWVKRARQEHDAFADTLRDRGVEVLYVGDLLAETDQGRRAPARGCSTGSSPSATSAVTSPTAVRDFFEVRRPRPRSPAT